jgi:CheY-like chemotaxis protein
VILEVGDTGCGMSSEIQSRIFDPFFTTKATGRGLGLSAMLGILKGHRAGIKIYSEQGKGSVFKIFFPAHSGAVAEPVPSKPAAARTCSGLALLVDDEPAILETMSRALQRMGFDVLTAGNGEEALLQLREHPKVGIVIMDLTMPKMDGREAFRAIRRLYPSLPVILSSGYSEQDSVQDLVGKGVTAFIQKPYQLSELQRMIQVALPAAAPPAEA